MRLHEDISGLGLRVSHNYGLPFLGSLRNGLQYFRVYVASPCLEMLPQHGDKGVACILAEPKAWTALQAADPQNVLM